MNDLVTHIENLNAKTTVWVNEDPKNRWAGLLVTELAHWERYGVTTPAQFDHYMLVTEVYEMTRSVYGYKPSWAGLNGLTDEALRKEINFLAEENNRQIVAEREEELAEKRATERAMTPKSWTIGELVSL